MRIELDEPDRDWTVEGVYEVRPDLYRIPLPLPSDGLKAVNVYAMRDGDGLVLIDSGWAIDEARAVLDKALGALGHEFADVHRFLITHVHRDHYTLSVRLRREFGNHISLGIGEQPSLRETADPDRPPFFAMSTKLHRCGAVKLAAEVGAQPREHDVSDWEDPDEWLAPPTDVALRTRTLQAVSTPGHTQGHVVFVDEGWDAMFAGDHVLPHITPSIGLEGNVAHSPLRDYLQSLQLVLSLPDRVLLPAHGLVSPSVHTRVDELLAHHAERLDAMAAVVTDGSTAFDVAQRVTWTRRGRNFADLDVFNQCLAICETGAHLDVLTERGRLRRSETDGVRHYRV
ncbi:MBL fold metallo-hydrolase [Pseudonocardia spinosispora]|uniref:MBL fold metallo-hydrolase n=1 Tax=Pseudonocardia spinosispora TaxID=103441 RepID=UPI00041F2B1F|nr:MBL fold metallo-hydrolase [Pseudonocardia spinosispora]